MSRKELMPVLLKHEAMAAENFRSRLAGLQKTFKDGRALFAGLTKSYEPLYSEGQQFPGETKEVETTVSEELLWFKEFFVTAINASVRKEKTNQKAETQVTILGEELGMLPATALLNLENKLKLLKNVMIHIPTLPTSVKWENHDDSRKIFVKTPSDWDYRTEKTPERFVKHEGDNKHPPQVEIIYVDNKVGKWNKRLFSGAISTAVKSEMLKNIDKAIDEVVAARELANLVEAEEIEDIGTKLFNKLFEEIL